MIDGPPPEQTTKWRQPSVARHLAREPRELTRLVIIFGLGLEVAGDVALDVVGRRGFEPVGRLGLRDTRRAIDDQRRFDLCFVEQQFGLEQLELKAHRAQILAQQELIVLKGELVGRIGGLRSGGRLLGELRVVFCFVKTRTMGLLVFCH
jgi:hypothetical protein